MRVAGNQQTAAHRCLVRGSDGGDGRRPSLDGGVSLACWRGFDVVDGGGNKQAQVPTWRESLGTSTPGVTKPNQGITEGHMARTATRRIIAMSDKGNGTMTRGGRPFSKPTAPIGKDTGHALFVATESKCSRMTVHALRPLKMAAHSRKTAPSDHSPKHLMSGTKPPLGYCEGGLDKCVAPSTRAAHTVRRHHFDAVLVSLLRTHSIPTWTSLLCGISYARALRARWYRCHYSIFWLLQHLRKWMHMFEISVGDRDREELAMD